MEQQETIFKNKGGRPKKEVKRNIFLALKCSAAERQLIVEKAKSVGLSISEYLREMALGGKIDIRKKAFPQEILNFTATLNHLAANLNQLAKKRNGIDELSVIERAELKLQSGQLQALAMDIKTFLQ
ncbi:plasmid mobilization protein [Mucilaginibacter defluvii]|uniref:Mobilization protein MobC n=1 Tax=Mucilaginibacter defluvii TaxID=1196019 RepID=A0ABP9G800_9SPHI